MAGIDLRPFCADADDPRSYLYKPFSHGEFTYAANGHIMVRVPRRGDVPDVKATGAWDRPFAGGDSAVFETIELSGLPEPERSEECYACEGSKTEHDCPSCECACPQCDGEGSLPEKVSATLFGAAFDIKYLRKIAGLPGLQLARVADPLLFRFDGGDGAIMPIRGRFANHIEDIAPRGEAA